MTTENDGTEYRHFQYLPLIRIFSNLSEKRMVEKYEQQVHFVQLFSDFPILLRSFCWCTDH